MPLPVAKAAAERILSRPPAAWIGRSRTRARRLVLAYHNVVSDDTPPSGDASLHIRLREFARQMDHLQAAATVVPLQRLVDSGHDSGEDGKPLVAVTFDDAYRGAVTFGVEALAERGMAATIFVAPGLLGDAAFWWDLVRWPEDVRTASRIRNHALGKLEGQRERVLEWAEAEGPGIRPVPAILAPASESEVLAAAERTGIQLGSHTWSHPSLPALGAQAIRRELGRSMDWLSKRVPGFLPWISYPYGHHCARTRQEAVAAGYRGGLQVSGGWFAPTGTDRYQVPRLNVPSGISLDGFRTRIAGFLADR